MLNTLTPHVHLQCNWPDHRQSTIPVAIICIWKSVFTVFMNDHAMVYWSGLFISAMQVRCVPKVVAAGCCFDGLLLWMAMTLEERVKPVLANVSSEEFLSMAKDSLTEIHKAGLLHGNISAKNILLTQRGIVFTGLSNASLSENEEEFSAEQRKLGWEIPSIKLWELWDFVALQRYQTAHQRTQLYTVMTHRLRNSINLGRLQAVNSKKLSASVASKPLTFVFQFYQGNGPEWITPWM